MKARTPDKRQKVSSVLGSRDANFSARSLYYQVAKPVSKIWTWRKNLDLNCLSDIWQYSQHHLVFTQSNHRPSSWPHRTQVSPSSYFAFSPPKLYRGIEWQQRNIRWASTYRSEGQVTSTFAVKFTLFLKPLTYVSPRCLKLNPRFCSGSITSWGHYW